MIIITGKSVYGGIAIGKIKFLKKEESSIKKKHIDNIEPELHRFFEAKKKTKRQLENLYDKAVVEVGETNAAIFEIHNMMLDDEDFNNSIINIINSQRVNAEYAVAQTSENFAKMFSDMDDEYMKARAVDVKDISERIITCLSDNGNMEAEEKNYDENFIICANDLAPSETVQLDKNKVLAFVTFHGSTNSHTAILARTMNIPAIVNLSSSFGENFDGKLAVVDGNSGKFYIDPDEKTLVEMQKKQKKDKEEKELLQELKGKENITIDGTRINVYANIGSPSDIGNVIFNDAGGIGLFRSEFIYLESKDFPSEEKQLLIYKNILENMVSKKVIIRTLDIGADKKIDYFNLKSEENPALGYRAIRICLNQKNIFKTQLRALFRASVYGNLSIMFPMITSEWEVIEILNIIEGIKKELEDEKIDYSEVEIGIMIETPAAAIISDKLAKYVDFFSIGTNDLTQYTLAVDRQNQQIEEFYDSHHTAVMRMIQFTAENAHKAGKWVGICGEVASDLTLTEEFLKMGIDELSVSPSYILALRDKIRKINLKKY